jgi:hypothetical protein
MPKNPNLQAKGDSVLDKNLPPEVTCYSVGKMSEFTARSQLVNVAQIGVGPDVKNINGAWVGSNSTIWIREWNGSCHLFNYTVQLQSPSGSSPFVYSEKDF